MIFSVVRITRLQAFVLQLLVVYCDLKDYNLVFSIQKVYSTQDGVHINVNSTPVLICCQTKSSLTSSSQCPCSTNLFISASLEMSGLEYRWPVWFSISLNVL